jgi:thymidylate synthase (FAD)
MAHNIVPEAEKILDKKFKVLNKGFVRLVDYMGSDQRIVQAARVSYGEGAKTFREDKGLINYLLRNDHTSPFEQVIFTFHIKLPIFVARQWIRHRTARVNEISGRYSVMKPEFYIPSGGDVSFQSTDNKQGRSKEKVSPELQKKIIRLLTSEQEELYRGYKSMLSDNVAKELARINLPLSLYTEWYWQIDLHNLFHFLKLRLHPHAQKEIRLYAGKMMQICQLVCPFAFEAFEEHILNGVGLSIAELQAVKEMLDNKKPTLGEKALKRLSEKLQRDLP